MNEFARDSRDESGFVSYDVATLGESMVMVAPVRPERLTHAIDLQLEVGGAESNVALHLAKLGHRVSWTGRLGDDPFGQRVLRTIAAGRVDTSSAVLDPLGHTGVYFKDPHPTGTRVHYYRADSAASRMNPELLGSIPIAFSRIVHLTGITPALSASCADLIDAVIDEAHRVGTAVSFDVNYRHALWPVDRAAAALERLIRQSDIVFVGRDEAETVWGTTTAEQIHSRFPAPGRLVVKDGDIGATEFFGQSVAFVPSLPVDVVEVVGAGDAFAAGYLSALLHGQNGEPALARGHSIAAEVLTTMADFNPGSPQ